MPDSLTGQAEALLDQLPPPPPLPETEPAGSLQRVQPAEVLKMYRLRHVEQMTIEAISACVGRSVGTVHHYLTQLEQPTVEAAEKLLRYSALPAAQVVVTQLDSKSEKVAQGAARTVLQASGLMSERQQITVGVSIVIGAQPTDLPTLQVLDSKASTE